ncbi:MAG: DMT family transporter [Pseudomonadota bacterium]
MAKLSPNVFGIVMALVSFALFAVQDAIVKALGGTYSPVQILFFNALLGFPLLTLMLIRDQVPGTLRPHFPFWTGLRTAMVVITNLCSFYAFSVLPLAETYALLFASPLIITILSVPMLGEKVGFRRLAAVMVGLTGVLVVLQPGSVSLGLGHLAALVSAVTGATGAVVVRKIRPILKRLRREHWWWERRRWRCSSSSRSFDHSQPLPLGSVLPLCWQDVGRPARVRRGVDNLATDNVDVMPALVGSASTSAAAPWQWFLPQRLALEILRTGDVSGGCLFSVFGEVSGQVGCIGHPRAVVLHHNVLSLVGLEGDLVQAVVKVRAPRQFVEPKLAGPRA